MVLLRTHFYLSTKEPSTPYATCPKFLIQWLQIRGQDSLFTFKVKPLFSGLIWTTHSYSGFQVSLFHWSRRVFWCLHNLWVFFYSSSYIYIYICLCRHEAKAIKQIVDTISNMLFPLTSIVDEDLVGMRARLQELEAQVEIGSPGVRIIGIWGVGGSGKTTLASSLSRKISHYFEGHCTLENIREESNKHGLRPLQKKIISRLLKKREGLNDVEEGKRLISRLRRSNVLVILDDVDDIKQLEALAGSPDWFGSGSRIIITTRNEHLLLTHKVDYVYPIRLLSCEEATQLFNKRAYNEKKPLQDYEALSLQVVSYAARLPLALKVLGYFLYDKDEKEWRSTLDRLKDTPHSEILNQLKISYDGLESEEKELFLDIACFFVRWKSTGSIRKIFEACGYHHDIGIKVLKQKALITIVDDMFDMHDLIQEMGHYIVRHEHPNDPEKHSRVWKCEEIENMCLGDATMVIYGAVWFVKYNEIGIAKFFFSKLCLVGYEKI